MVPVDPGGTLGLEHEAGPVGLHVHVPPPVVTADAETNIVLAGVGSVSVAVLQLLGPLFVTICVYVILLPAVTGLGLPLLVTARSQLLLT